MNRRDLLLNEMNIAQWVLSKPQVLKGDAQIRLNAAVKLVVVCDEDHRKSRFFQDVLRTLALNVSQYQWLNVEQALRLTFTHEPIIWCIQPDSQAVRLTKKFTNQPLWRISSWQALHTPAAKRQLWQQMQPFCRHIEDNL
ncbi:DNA polymerase III subunit psi [Muribacter muris]|uniref:DNA polymerase III subunit psi n=1 Tax=Muribacter muris TaxID=67855 RepID=A0A4Y9K9B4_9PAST|nr:DNA polymerase III subunit psi [Muribacter muris]MBF0784145.1 DNA polymerase III subunit psi [Muribacter muris]MBF0827640.1 DNA polymerase III subunit psi [Muribacter muris]TFV13196.1 DNA polymerase III subunit psi [Muribacter muris]